MNNQEINYSKLVTWGFLFGGALVFLLCIIAMFVPITPLSVKTNGYSLFQFFKYLAERMKNLYNPEFNGPRYVLAMILIIIVPIVILGCGALWGFKAIDAFKGQGKPNTIFPMFPPLFMIGLYRSFFCDGPVNYGRNFVMAGAILVTVAAILSIGLYAADQFLSGESRKPKQLLALLAKIGMCAVVSMVVMLRPVLEYGNNVKYLANQQTAAFYALNQASSGFGVFITSLIIPVYIVSCVLACIAMPLSLIKTPLQLKGSQTVALVITTGVPFVLYIFVLILSSALSKYRPQLGVYMLGISMSVYFIVAIALHFLDVQPNVEE